MPYTNNIEGYISPVELDWLHEQAKNFQSIVEIGSYLGRSTTALCDAGAKMVYAVDIFRDEDFPRFIKNMGVRENLTVLREPSLVAAKRFADKSVNMVFLDGDHSYESCRDDISAWLPKCNSLFCLHDYSDDKQGHWPGVVRAVDELYLTLGYVLPTTITETLFAIWVNPYET